MRRIWVVLDYLMLPLWPVAYLFARLDAKPCPRCGERWFTELEGDIFGQEDWYCRRCNHRW